MDFPFTDDEVEMFKEKFEKWNKLRILDDRELIRDEWLFMNHFIRRKGLDLLQWAVEQHIEYMRRKPIRISATDTRLIALCNDGTLWEKGRGWCEIPPIPQDESTED